MSTEREGLSAICLSYLMPPKFAGGSWTLNPDDLADAILSSDWLFEHDRRVIEAAFDGEPY